MSSRLEIYNDAGRPMKLSKGMPAIVDEKGSIELYANTFNTTPDSHGDISAKGSFKRTLQGGASQRVKHYVDHRVSMEYLAGMPVEMSEDSVGLKVISKLNLKSDIGKNLYENYKFFQEMGKPLEHSIGYEEKARDPNDDRVITEYKLWEYSTVALASNQWSLTTGVKKLSTKSEIEQLSDQLQKLIDRNYSTDMLKAIETQLNILHAKFRGDDSAQPLIDEATEQAIITGLGDIKNILK